MAKSSSEARRFVGDEIRHLMKQGPSKGPLKGRKFGQKQAVAAALNVARDKGYDVGPEPKEETMSVFDALTGSSTAASTPKWVRSDKLTYAHVESVFDSITSKPINEQSDRPATTLALVESLAELKTKNAG